MTDNEIIKALGQCETQKTCSDCPYFEKIGCKKHLYQDAYTLINRQKEEIERLKGWENLLKSEKHSLIKSEAIKEFAKRLKNKIITECNPYGKPTFDYDTSIWIMRYIDNLVKEMVGDVIAYAMRDFDDYLDECYEEEISPQDTCEDFIADGILIAGYRKQSEGEWIKDKNRRTCSECGFMYFGNGSSFDFCPKCGAIMKGGEGNDTERVL